MRGGGGAFLIFFLALPTAIMYLKANAPNFLLNDGVPSKKGGLKNG